MKIDVFPLIPERWADFEQLFGVRGACGGCWCMYWRLRSSDFEAQKGEGNRQQMRSLVESGEVPGLLGYVEQQPVGWVSVAPRAEYIKLERSRILKPIDDQPVWSVVCFFVARGFRKQGIMLQLLHQAVAFAAAKGAKIVEGYPVEPKAGQAPDVFIYTGVASTFRKAGFVEVARRSETRPIMRYQVE
jgi:GNAT superfamily N-acetyltransferase